VHVNNSLNSSRCISQHSLFFIFALVLALYILIQPVYLAPRGLDLTDESYYLMWTADPWAYIPEVSLFGFFYHPLYILTGGDITYLRVTNLLFTWLLFYGCALALVKKTALSAAPAWSVNQAHLHLAALFLTVPAQLLLAFIRSTPNYNTLCAQGLALAVWGLLLIEHERRACMLSGWIMLGLGGYMTFMGKPSSALLLGMVVLVYLSAAHRDKLPWVFLAVLTALAALTFTAATVSGSLENFVHEYTWVLQQRSGEGSQYQSGPMLKRFFSTLGWPWKGWLIFFAVAGASYAYVTRVAAGNRKLVVCGEALLWALVLIGLGWMSGFLPSPRKIFAYESGFAFALLSAPAGALLACRPPTFRSVQTRLLKIVLLLLVMPYIFAFGTDHPYIRHALLCIVFWLPAAVLLMAAFGPERAKILAACKITTAASLCIIAGLAQHSVQYPYRQTHSLLRQSRVITAAGTGHTFIVSDDMHEYLAGLQKLAADAGFKNGQCLLDMTGHSPGAVHMLGAKAPGKPWLFGGYAASRHWLTSYLDRLPSAALKSCWILVEPEGPRPLDTAWFAKYGLNVDTYIEVGVLSAPYKEQSFRQVLLKPE